MAAGKGGAVIDSEDEYTVSADPMPTASAAVILATVDAIAEFVAQEERFRQAGSELRRVDFWGTGHIWDKELEELGRQLAGRAPLFHSECLLEPGAVFWTPEGLPRVFVAPNVFEALKRAGGRV